MRVFCQIEPTQVYDAGPRTVARVTGSGALSAAASTIVAAAASLKTKVIGISIGCSVFTGAGIVQLKSGAGGTVIWSAGFGAVGRVECAYCGGVALCETATNTLLEIHNTGNATLSWSVVYYQAA